MATYTINLEDIDVMPLLTMQSNNFLKKEYFEFQVMAVDEPIQPIGTYKTYTCHICDIQVPVSFVNEHTRSIKHIANTNIASEAASRLKSLVLAPPPSPSSQEPTAFCANCSLLVDRNHENTGEHIAAVNKDKQLWDLMNIYVKNIHDSGLASKESAVDKKNDSIDAEIDNTAINGKDTLEWDVKNNISASKVLAGKVSAVDKKKDSNDAETAIDNTAINGKDKLQWDLMNVNKIDINASKSFDTKESVEDKKKDSNDAETAIDNTAINGKDKLQWDLMNVNKNDINASKGFDIKKKDSNDAETAIDNTAINGKDKLQWDLMNVNKNDINASKGFDTKESVVDKKKDSNDAETIDHTASSNVINKQTVPTSSRGFKSFTIAKNIDEHGITRENYREQLRERYEDSYIELLHKVNNNYSDYKLQEWGTNILIYKGNEVVCVPANNFHGFIHTLSYVTCMLCRADFHPDYAHTHKYETIHLNQLMTSNVADYVRKARFGTRHCIICNLKLKQNQVDLHVKSREHIENKNKYTKTKKQQEETEITDCDITKKLSNTEAVAETRKHDIVDAEINILESPAESVRDINSNDTEKLKNRIVRKTVDTINNYVTDNITVNKEGNVTDNGERVLTADVACATTDVDDEENDITDDKDNTFEHAALVRNNEIGTIKQTVGYQAVEKSSDSEIRCMFEEASEKKAICIFCKCKLPNTLKCMREHVRGWNHRTAVDRVNSLTTRAVSRLAQW